MTPPRRRFGKNKLELGLFSFNVQNGLSVLKDEIWDSAWHKNVRLAQLAEAAGMEFLLPLGKWQSPRPFDLEPDAQGGNYETTVWAAGLLQATQRIAIFATLHVAYLNPVFAAKQLVTAHHIGEGRFGLNIVSGTIKKDFAMFGFTPNDHDGQYDYTEEWLTIAKRLWTEEEPFDFDGTFFKLTKAISKPKPYGGQLPMLISAGHSHRGRAFAVNNANALFTSISEIDNATIELAGARASAPDGDAVPIYGSCHLVTRKTKKETEEYYHHLVYEIGAWENMDEKIAVATANRTVPYASIDRLKERIISGSGTHLIKGDYDEVAAYFKRLYDSGFNGMAVSMIDYIPEFETFRDEIVPRLERMGLREPFRG